MKFILDEKAMRFDAHVAREILADISTFKPSAHSKNDPFVHSTRGRMTLEVREQIVAKFVAVVYGRGGTSLHCIQASRCSLCSLVASAAEVLAISYTLAMKLFGNEWGHSKVQAGKTPLTQIPLKGKVESSLDFSSSELASISRPLKPEGVNLEQPAWLKSFTQDTKVSVVEEEPPTTSQSTPKGKSKKLEVPQTPKKVSFPLPSEETDSDDEEVRAIMEKESTDEAESCDDDLDADDIMYKMKKYITSGKGQAPCVPRSIRHDSPDNSAAANKEAGPPASIPEDPPSPKSKAKRVVLRGKRKCTTAQTTTVGGVTFEGYGEDVW
jgi:hypothetical protein